MLSDAASVVARTTGWQECVNITNHYQSFTYRPLLLRVMALTELLWLMRPALEMVEENMIEDLQCVNEIKEINVQITKLDNERKTSSTRDWQRDQRCRYMPCVRRLEEIVGDTRDPTLRICHYKVQLQTLSTIVLYDGAGDDVGDNWMSGGISTMGGIAEAARIDDEFSNYCGVRQKLLHPTSISMSGRIVRVGNNMFAGSNAIIPMLTRLTLENLAIREIGEDCMSDIRCLREVSINGCAALERIGNGWLQFCQQLTKVSMNGCTNLEHIGKRWMYYTVNPGCPEELLTTGRWFNADPNSPRICTLSVDGCAKLHEPEDALQSYWFVKCPDMDIIGEGRSAVLLREVNRRRKEEETKGSVTRKKRGRT